VLLYAKDYKTHFEALVLNDLAVFEEKRLQHLLICRAQAPSHSVKVAENEFLGVWDQTVRAAGQEWRLPPGG
jgi:hypothetical protein